jgi:hypothetical protein
MSSEKASFDETLLNVVSHKDGLLGMVVPDVSS